MTALRPYQAKAVVDIEQAPERAVLLPAPTASGKTVVASAVIQRAPNTFTLFLVHRRELVHQARDRLAQFGVPAGVILAGEPLDQTRQTQVASIQTLHARCVRGRQDLPPAGIVVVDECHHAPAQSWRSIIERFPNAKIIGLSATPCRKDGRGLGGIFQRLIPFPQVQDLVDGGYLIKTTTYAPPSTGSARGAHARR
jgi:superfamily II DNA or RNA helicase